MSEFFSWQGEDLILKVKVLPNSSVNKLEPFADRLKVKLTTSPVGGKANKHLIRYLADVFSVPASAVKIEKGSHRSLKTVRICHPGNLPRGITIAPNNSTVV